MMEGSARSSPAPSTGDTTPIGRSPRQSSVNQRKIMVSPYKEMQRSSDWFSKVTLSWSAPLRKVLIASPPGSDESIDIHISNITTTLLKVNDSLEVYIDADEFPRDLKDTQRVHHWGSLDDRGSYGTSDADFDFIVSVGGDSAVLHISRTFQKAVPPVFSICAVNCSSRGFLNPFRISDISDGGKLHKATTEASRIALRARLLCTIKKKIQNGCEIPDKKFSVLNEIVIDRGPSPYISNLDVFCEGEFVTRVQADGVIIATPTGSTAYSVSAGGSMVHPAVACMLLTPVCPHSLSFRPIIVPASVHLEIRIPQDSRAGAWVSMDGRNRQELLAGETIVVNNGASVMPTVCLKSQSMDWFRSLSECLNWNVDDMVFHMGPSPTKGSTTQSRVEIDNGQSGTSCIAHYSANTLPTPEASFIRERSLSMRRGSHAGIRSSFVMCEDSCDDAPWLQDLKSPRSSTINGREEIDSGINELIRISQKLKSVALQLVESAQAVLVIKKPDPSIVPSLEVVINYLLKEEGLVVFVEGSAMEELNNQLQSSNRVHTWNWTGPDKLGPDENQELKRLYEELDLVICLGGDGTLMYTAGQFQSTTLPVPPVMAFSFGSLGFLTPFKFDNHQESLKRVLHENTQVTLRMRFLCKVIRGDKYDEYKSKDEDLADATATLSDVKPTYSVLNEVVIDRGPSPYLTDLEVYCDGRLITRVKGDGLMFATPTGSTAYSVSAGGSMVHPAVSCILMTPICPFSLSFRPIILPSTTVIEVKVPVTKRKPAWVSMDGKNRQKLYPGDYVRLSNSAQPVPTLGKVSQSADWFHSLSECLNWNLREMQKPMTNKL
eukprot:m.122670 g.122670  ORF g.122670 m.122670 type:complete len:833 (+) comp14428_c0_seq1:198-2696(+)